MSLRALRHICVFMVLLCLLVALSGCDSQPEQKPALPSVRYSLVKGEQVTLSSELPGRVSALMLSEVRPQVSGIIQERLFEEGADVKKGQVLYRIDPALFQAAFNNAKANLAKAEANQVSARLLSERYGKIIKSNAVSRQEYDDAISVYEQALADVESARQDLETARINLSYTEVKAPVSGRIGRSFVTAGALVTASQSEPLAAIQHLDTVYVDVTQSNTELLRMRRALARGDMRSNGPDSAVVRLKLEDGSPYSRNMTGLAVPEGEEPDWITGELLFSDVTIEKSTGVVNIRARFDNPHNILLPGMYVRAIVEEGVLDNAVLVPQKTVQRDTRGRAYVYVLRESANPDHPHAYDVEMRHVEIDRNIGHKWLIASGLEPGERLLVDGHLKARPGVTVAGMAMEPKEILSAGRQDAVTSR